MSANMYFQVQERAEMAGCLRSHVTEKPWMPILQIFSSSSAMHTSSQLDLPRNRTTSRVPRTSLPPSPLLSHTAYHAFLLAPATCHPAEQARVCDGDDRHREDRHGAEPAELAGASGGRRGAKRRADDGQLLRADVLAGHAGTCVHLDVGPGRPLDQARSGG